MLLGFDSGFLISFKRMKTCHWRRNFALECGRSKLQTGALNCQKQNPVTDISEAGFALLGETECGPI